MGVAYEYFSEIQIDDQTLYLPRGGMIHPEQASHVWTYLTCTSKSEDLTIKRFRNTALTAAEVWAAKKLLGEAEETGTMIAETIVGDDSQAKLAAETSTIVVAPSLRRAASFVLQQKGGKKANMGTPEKGMRNAICASKTTTNL